MGSCHLCLSGQGTGSAKPGGVVQILRIELGTCWQTGAALQHSELLLGPSMIADVLELEGWCKLPPQTLQSFVTGQVLAHGGVAARPP